jgi:hypothetical protein
MMNIIMNSKNMLDRSLNRLLNIIDHPKCLIQNNQTF